VGCLNAAGQRLVESGVVVSNGPAFSPVALPTPNITSAAMAFPEGRGDDPQAGNLFVYKPGVAGTPVTSYPH